MNKEEALQLVNTIWSSLFNSPPPFHSLDEAKKLLANSIPLPYPVPTQKEGESGFITPTYFVLPKKFINFQTLKPSKVESSVTGKLPSPQAIIQHWIQDYTYVSNKIINSSNVQDSDNIYKSNNIYNSCYIFNSQNIIFSRQLGQCRNIIASYNNELSTNSIRLSDSVNCSNCFNVSWSNKVSNSFFIHNGYNLHECMFSAHIYSKRYCIANTQFKKEEYFYLKSQILDYLMQDKGEILFKLLALSYT